MSNAFEDYINSCGDDLLEPLSHVVNCTTTHEYVVKASRAYAAAPELFPKLLSKLERQIATCLASEVVLRIGETETHDDENEDIIVFKDNEGRASMICFLLPALQEVLERNFQIAFLAALLASEGLAVEAPLHGHMSAFADMVWKVLRLAEYIGNTQQGDGPEVMQDLFRTVESYLPLLGETGLDEANRKDAGGDGNTPAEGEESA